MTVDLDPTLLAVLAIVATALGVIAVVLSLAALRRLRRLRRSMTLLQGEDGSESFVDAVGRQVAEVERLRADVTAVSVDVEQVRVDLAAAIRHVAVVRYDAFNDMGGRMSFSAALLDDAGDGVVISSINGRSETRTYAKGVQSGRSEASLSPEEEQAVGYARRGRD